MYVLAMQVKVSLHKQEEFLQALRSLQSDQEKETGITSLKLYKDAEDRTTFSLINRWKTEEDLAKCLGGEKFKVLLGALQVLCEESAIKYKHIPENLLHHLEPMLNLVNCDQSW